MNDRIGSASRTAIVVAVTGHTNFDAAVVPAIRAQLHRALGEIEAAVEDSVGEVTGIRGTVRRRDDGRRDSVPSSHRLGIRLGHTSRRRRVRPARPILISCLAPGTDQLASDEALRLGYELQAVLPGPPAEYRAAFHAPDDIAQHLARSEFDRLLGACGAVATIDLALPPGDGAVPKLARRAAYDAATEHMVRYCDLLIAVADLLNREDLGTTAKTISWVLRAGKPVLWIDPSRPDRLRWLSHLSAEEFDERLGEPASTRAVPDIVPDDAVDVHGAVPAPATDEFVVRTLRRQVSSVLHAKREALRYRAEPRPARRSRVARWAVGIWRTMLERWLPTTMPKGVVADERDDDEAGVFARWWRQQRSGYIVAGAMLRAMARSLAGAPPPTSSPTDDARAAGASDASDGDAMVQGIVGEVERERRRASELAVFYAGAHRSSFLVMAILGVVAVGLASYPAPPVPGEEERWLTLARILGASEVVVLLGMFGIYYANRTRGWQSKSIDYRVLAERLRHATVLLLVGRDWSDASALPVQYSELTLGKSWMEPYFQRMMARIQARLDAQWPHRGWRDRFDDAPGNAGYVRACRAYVAQNWLAGQARYQRELATKYEALNLMLESLQFTLIVFTAVICVVHVLAHQPLLTFFAGVLPAASGALGSIAAQAEVVRLRDRALSMQRALERKLRELTGTASESGCEALRHFVESTAQHLLGEALEWRVVFKFRPISSPA